MNKITIARRYFVVLDGPLKSRVEHYLKLRRDKYAMAQEYCLSLGAVAIAYRNQSIPVGLAFEGEPPKDWKHSDDALVNDEVCKVYMPRRGTKKGKNLHERIMSFTLPHLDNAMHEVLGDSIDGSYIIYESNRATRPTIGYVHDYIVLYVPEYADTKKPFNPPTWLHEIKVWEYQRLQEEGVVNFKEAA